MKSLVKHYPVSMYLVFTFLISWGGVFLLTREAAFAGVLTRQETQLAMGVVMLLGPFVSGLTMAFLTAGREGLLNLFARMKSGPADRRWYTACLIFPVLIIGITFFLSTYVSSEFQPIFFLPGFLIGLLAGFVEETGWMGFAWPHLRQRSILVGGVFLGLIHAIWHLPADWISHHGTFAAYWFPYFVGFMVFVVALRILIVWVYTNTGSLLLAQIMHASSTGFLAVLVTVNLEPYHWVLFYGAYASVLVGACMLVVSLFGAGLVRENQ